MRKLLVFTLMLLVSTAFAQNAYNGVHKYDGEHKNEISGYITAGKNTKLTAFVAIVHILKVDSSNRIGTNA